MSDSTEKKIEVYLGGWPKDSLKKEVFQKLSKDHKLELSFVGFDLEHGGVKATLPESEFELIKKLNIEGSIKVGSRTIWVRAKSPSEHPAEPKHETEHSDHAEEEIRFEIDDYSDWDSDGFRPVKVLVTKDKKPLVKTQVYFHSTENMHWNSPGDQPTDHVTGKTCSTVTNDSGEAILLIRFADPKLKRTVLTFSCPDVGKTSASFKFLNRRTI